MRLVQPNGGPLLLYVSNTWPLSYGLLQLERRFVALHQHQRNHVYFIQSTYLVPHQEARILATHLPVVSSEIEIFYSDSHYVGSIPLV